MNWNSANGQYFNLRWSKSKWRVESMADGGPIPNMLPYGSKVEMVAYELPIVESFVWGRLGGDGPRPFQFSASAILAAAHIHTEDAATDACSKLLRANEEAIEASGYSESFALQIKRKLKWKKVAA